VIHLVLPVHDKLYLRQRSSPNPEYSSSLGQYLYNPPSPPSKSLATRTSSTALTAIATPCQDSKLASAPLTQTSRTLDIVRKLNRPTTASSAQRAYVCNLSWAYSSVPISLHHTHRRCRTKRCKEEHVFGGQKMDSKPTTVMTRLKTPRR